jgi:hypothetical protein
MGSPKGFPDNSHEGAPTTMSTTMAEMTPTLAQVGPAVLEYLTENGEALNHFVFVKNGEQVGGLHVPFFNDEHEATILDIAAGMGRALRADAAMICLDSIVNDGSCRPSQDPSATEAILMLMLAGRQESNILITYGRQDDGEIEFKGYAMDCELAFTAQKVAKRFLKVIKNPSNLPQDNEALDRLLAELRESTERFQPVS